MSSQKLINIFIIYLCIRNNLTESNLNILKWDGPAFLFRQRKTARMNKPSGERQRHEVRERHHWEIAHFHAKINWMENELKEMSDRLKGELAGRERLRREMGGQPTEWAENDAKSALLRERIRANVTEMEQHLGMLQQSQTEIGVKFSEIGKLLTWLIRARKKQHSGDFSLVSPFSSPTNDSFPCQQNAKSSPLLAIDLFELRHFRNGNANAQCMECGRKFATTDEAAMGWHIVQQHAQYAPKLLQKQLDLRREGARKRKGVPEGQQNGAEATVAVKLFKDYELK